MQSIHQKGKRELSHAPLDNGGLGEVPFLWGEPLSPPFVRKDPSGAHLAFYLFLRMHPVNREGKGESYHVPPWWLRSWHSVGLGQLIQMGPSLCVASPRVPCSLQGIHLGGRSIFLILFLHILFAGMGRLSRTMLPSMVEMIAFNELQTGNTSEASVPLVGSRNGVL